MRGSSNAGFGELSQLSAPSPGRQSISQKGEPTYSRHNLGPTSKSRSGAFPQQTGLATARRLRNHGKARLFSEKGRSRHRSVESSSMPKISAVLFSLQPENARRAEGRVPNKSGLVMDR